MEKLKGIELIERAKEMFKDFSDEEFIKLYKETMQLLYTEKKRRFDDLEMGVEVPDMY